MMISVVIPALNEQKYLGRCLESLARQDYQGSFEIIVVDNGSSDGTVAVANSYGVKVVSEARTGVAFARAKGFKAAQGEIIASTDADTILPANWLSQIESLFTKHPDAVVVAGHYSLMDGPIVVRLVLKFSLIVIPAIIKFFPRLWNFPGSDFAVKSTVFRAIGGFNPGIKIYEDVDLCQRLRKQGMVVFCPQLIVSTSGRAFATDPLGLRHLLNYLSHIFTGKAVLPVELGAELQSKAKNYPHR